MVWKVKGLKKAGAPGLALMTNVMIALSLPMASRFEPLLIRNLPDVALPPAKIGVAGLVTSHATVPPFAVPMRKPKLKATSLNPPSGLRNVEMVLTRTGAAGLATL